MAAVEKLAQSKTAQAEPSPFAAINFGAYAKRIVSFLARNFFTMKFIALAIAFSINFMLLFYKVRDILKLRHTNVAIFDRFSPSHLEHFHALTLMLWCNTNASPLT